MIHRRKENAAMKSSSLILAALAVCALSFWPLACAKRRGGAGASAPATGSAPASKTVAVVNSKCPIMGSALDKNVPEDLTRTFKGQKVGFCCDDCPPQWDKLFDAEKDAKLQGALAK
jgi:hypothetical protein